MQKKEAIVKYNPGNYDILAYGDYVICVQTGEKIALDELTYWNVERQEAYKDCQAAFERELEWNKHYQHLRNLKNM